MAFLDNSGDIVLDAVLTDTGRFRLARGDGSFKISKFALGDEEINYGSYNADHPSGSAYYDLEILQTPVLEAFTNNMSSMKSTLISMSNNNLLFLPTLKLNNSEQRNEFVPQPSDGEHNPGGFVVLVDQDTVDKWVDTATGPNSTTYSNIKGIINGVKPAEKNTTSHGTYVRVDQGLDTTELSGQFKLDPELTETRFIIQMDNRLAKLHYPGGSAKLASPAFIDDDQIASYYISAGTTETGAFIFACGVGEQGLSDQSGNNAKFEVHKGPRGNYITFTLQASIELNSSTFLFTQIGSTKNFGSNVATSHFYIDSTIRVQGATTGYKIDIPVRFLKLND